MTTEAQFLDLYHDFLHSYVDGAEARAYAAALPLIREEAAHNYRQIQEADARGDEITALVLTGLLPHADTEGNRQRGAWIHVAPAVSGDVVRWHERLGWARPEEWPQKARAIFDFVRTAVDEPARLSETCVAFNQNPVTTGFQSGTLSPILNALRPNLYLVVNRKTLQVVNYFSGSTYSQTIADYPAANAAGLEWVQVVREQGPELPLPLRAVDRFDLFCHWLVSVRRYDFPVPRFWAIRPGGEGQWDAWRTGGFVAMGFDEVGDLAGVSRAEFDRQRDRLAAQHEEWTKIDLNQLWRFARHVNEGDRVVVHNGEGEVLGVGTINGFYYYVPDVFMGHCRPVAWTDLQRRRFGELDQRRPFQEIDRQTLARIQQAPIVPEPRRPQPQIAESTPEYKTNDEDGAPVHASAPPPSTVRTPLPPYPLADVAAETGFPEDQLAEWVDAIERKGQAIFYGPPGTGKSFVASHLARHLAGGDDGFVEYIQFHPTYAYEDFVQGIRPVSEIDGTISYRLVPGRFMTFCREAVQRTGRCVLVIDEINRTDLARVFGEVMHLLEARDQAYALAAGGTLRVPGNVRLIGTMNTADRSIALLDAALRRRFAFLALFPDYEVLRRYHERMGTAFPVGGLIRVLRRINEQIGDPNQAVGITYFLRPDLETTIRAIWRTEIEPYLEEIFFDRLEQVEIFRWEKVAGEM